MYVTDLSVTVGIPTKDNADTIRATLESLVDGTHPPDRILVVDASDDETPDIVRDVADESDVPIDYVRQSREGRGVGAARQEIYERFDGDVLACLDTNLEIPDDWLERRMRFHETHSEYGVLTGTKTPGLDEPAEPGAGEYFRQGNCSITCEALDRVGGWDPWFARGEDWDMHLRLAAAGVESYTMSAVGATHRDEETPLQKVSKKLGRPSSVAFLRKYGLWYLRRHPMHVLGDVVSVVSLLVLVVLPVLAIWKRGLAAVASLLPLAGTAGYFHHRTQVADDVAYRRSDLPHVLEFYVLGYTTLRELLYGPQGVDWNRGGLEER